MIRKFLFQLHLWSGLILGIVFVLIGLSGSILIVAGEFPRPPAVHLTAAPVPALDKGLAAARAAVGAPKGTGAGIRLPKGSHDPVTIHFDGQWPAVLTDPATGRVLATYRDKAPDWVLALSDFHVNLSVPDSRVGNMVEGWLGLVMLFLGLTGLYLWWPKAGQWKYGFIVRRKAKGLRFHRELHGAAGIWTLVFYLVVTTTGVALEFFQETEAILAFATGKDLPRFSVPVAVASAEAVPIGPDAVFAAASKASNQPIEEFDMPGWKPGQPSLRPIRAASVLDVPIWVDPFHGTIINPKPPNTAYNITVMMVRLHEAYELGPVWTVLVFISGLMPLIFFVTGLMMWLKKRQNRLAMLQPLPESILEQQAP